MTTPTTSSAANGSLSREDVSRDYVGFLNAALDVVSTRVLALLGELGAIGMWVIAVWEPTSMRTWAALGYSGTVLIPLVLLHWRKG